MDLKIKFRAQPLPRHPRDPDRLLPDLCRGEGLLGAVVIAELLSILIVIAGSGLFPFDWLALGQVSLLALWITLLSALVLCLARRVLAGFGQIPAALLSYALILVVSALCSAVGQGLMVWWQPMGRETFSPWLVLQHLLIAAIPAGILLRYLFLQQQLRLQQRAELESRIQALQSRIRPHFLFNSMNMIASLIGSDPEKAERVVEDLADLFRHALTDSTTLVPLREELSLSRRYLALEKLRLGDRLQTVWEIGDYGSGVRIPCLTIQPVLENAVYHGIQLLPEGGVVAIKLTRTGDRIDIAVSNPRNPRIQHNKGNRMAMTNIQTRLAAHFGPTASIESEVTADSYITRISYPVPPDPSATP
jgi:two-component system sensor histidine kinase AlgZ